jgi:hypothetical protein
MPTIQASAIADIAASTLTQVRKGDTKWNDIASALTSYIALPEILKKQTSRFGDSYQYQWTLLKNKGDTARSHGLFNTANVTAKDVLATASIPWKHYSVDYGFDEREPAMNSGPMKIVDEIKARDAAYMIDLHDLIETDFWDAPADSNSTALYGIQYQIVYNSTDGFTGGAPSGWTTVNGVDPTIGAASAGYKNYSFTYTTNSTADSVKKLRKACYKTGWKSPVPGTDPKSQKFKIYTVYDNVAELENLALQQNDNVGNDLAAKDGMATLRGFPFIAVPQLDSVCGTSKPYYGIDWNVMFVAILKGFFMKPRVWQSATQPFVTNVTNTISCNIGCDSRRRLFVGAISDPTAS